eukprot:s23_g50.t1
MAGYAESNASFRARALQIQLSEDHVQALHDNDVRCFNHMAFAVNGQPGQLDQDRFQSLVDIVCPRGASLGVQASLKQLAYEALTVAVAAIKQRIEAPEEGGRKLPPQEKDQRLRDLKERITGFDISGEYEPGHCVIDAFASMLEEGVMKVFPLSKCVSRDQELQSVRVDKQVVLLENQQLHVKTKGAELTADLGSELRVHHAFIRRGLALDMANLGSYEVHEKVMREFMSHLSRPPPPGFKAASIDLVLRADKELWTRVADEVRSNLRPDKDKKLPVDEALKTLYTSAAVMFHLLPLPVGASQNVGTKRKAEDVEVKAIKGLPILVIDLNSDAQLKLFESLLQQRRLLYVHFAPPCGTASLARCIKLAYGRGPEPLRSLRWPMGLPRLRPAQKTRVAKANRLYALTWKYINLLDARGVGWSVENPASSLMWVTTFH